jgi:hypothetical protein
MTILLCNNLVRHSLQSLSNICLQEDYPIHRIEHLVVLVFKGKPLVMVSDQDLTDLRQRYFDYGGQSFIAATPGENKQIKHVVKPAIKRDPIVMNVMFRRKTAF